jgi:polyhydroxybutyrate depolymerase
MIYRHSPLLLLFAFLSFVSSLSAQQRINGTIMHDDLEREYLLYIPAAYDGQSDWPIVFNFHGYTSNASQQEAYSNMNAVADTANFLVCYPEGIDNAWNVGWSFGSTADDVGFVDALIANFSSNYRIDAERIFACGMSNGGFMSYRLACERSEVFAAVASVTGSLARNYDCEPVRPVPVLQIHGTADATVAYGGNALFSVAIDSTIAFWVAHNGCNATPRYREVPNTSITDLSTVEQFTYDECMEGSEVMLFKIAAGAHTWPGSPLPFPGTNYDINASEEIWHFFQRFRRTNAVSATSPFSESLAFQLSPNPSSGWLSISGIPTPFQLRVFNGFGQLSWQGQLKHPHIDLSELPSGTYFLQLQHQAQVGWAKWVKNP